MFSKCRDGDTAFVIRHHNDGFIRSDGGVFQVELLRNAPNMKAFALLVDQTDPDVLAKSTDLSPDKSAVVSSILLAYKRVATLSQKSKVDDFVEKLVISGFLSEAGRLKFLREHIENTSDDVLGRFPLALIKKLMIGTEGLDDVIQSNFLRWIDDLPYFTEIMVTPRTLANAIHELCLEESLSMSLLDCLIEEALSTLLKGLKSICFISAKVADLLMKYRLFKKS